MNRRKFIGQHLSLGGTALLGGSLVLTGSSLKSCDIAKKQEPSAAGNTSPDRQKLFEAMNRSVLDRKLLPDPVIVKTIEMRKSGKIYFVRAVSEEGIVGTATAKPQLLNHLFPIFNGRVKPYFEGKDARDLESLIETMYISQANYKWQSVPLWICVAVLEYALLDLLGRTYELNAAELIGGRRREETPIYVASGNRGNTAEEELEFLQKITKDYGTKAVKFRPGARMHYTAESTARDLAMIPLVRESLGEDYYLIVDANGSYDLEMSLRIGKLLEEYQYDVFEEPVPFDYFEETRDITHRLNIPIAGGEQERSLRQFLWLIEHRALDVVMVDPLLFGGLTRSMRVARMAELAGLPTAIHLSGYGLGYIYTFPIVAALPDYWGYMEYKGEKDDIPFNCPGNDLIPREGILRIPDGPGFGIDLDPDFLARGVVV